MQATRFKLRHGLAALAAMLIVKITIGVVLNYHEYFPASFESDFLQGREQYFWGPYSWAFYTHIVSSPLALLFGTVLISDQFRPRFPRWHKYLGRFQGACVLLFVAPSGLLMAQHAATGPVAAFGFSALALATGSCMAIGWRCAIRKEYGKHRTWMWRCYLMLCSAAVLRLTNGLATVAEIDGAWVYPMSAWTSWLVPLAIYEMYRSRISKRYRFCRQPIAASEKRTASLPAV